MNKKRAITLSAGLAGVLAVSSWLFVKFPRSAENSNSPDQALLALIKNDQAAFERFIGAGGNVHDVLPAIDGKVYSVAQGIAYFERAGFGGYLHAKKVSYVRQEQDADFDIMTLAVKKNNPELMTQMTLENPAYTLGYGKSGWTLMHMAAAWCSHRLTGILHDQGKVSWDHKAKDGSTPLTLAAESDCLPMLSFWKDRGADFKAKDGRGRTALAILKSKKDAALAAFAASFEERKIATVTVVKEAAVPDFYKKRKTPKDQIVDHAAMLEPEDRPLGATETAEMSEFAD